MKPFFTYFGGKWLLSKYYPKPTGSIVEPFAGSAGYSVRYAEAAVTLYEIDPKVFGVWDFLIRATPQEINALPSEVETTAGLKCHQEARWLIGFWLGRGLTKPNHKPGGWMKQGIWSKQFWGPNVKERIAGQVDGIKHWKVFNKSWSSAPNRTATWLIDPPYQHTGHRYVHSQVDYRRLSTWSKSRSGQILVCEQLGADWMDFKPFKSMQTLRSRADGKGAEKTEVLWHRPE